MIAFEQKVASLKEGEVALIGVPLDENSSFLRGAALAPPRIREALRSRSSNMSRELGIDLSAGKGWTDLGDLVLPVGKEALEKIDASISSVLARGGRAIMLGGDHSITYPILRAFGRTYRPLTILQIDAHADTYDEYEGNRYSHACPFARIMEEGLATRLVQVGVRSLTPCQRKQNERFGITAIEMKDWLPGITLEFEEPVYLFLDLDGMDPAFAPGVSHHEPGGLTSPDVLRIIHALPPLLVGADIVEFNPSRDPTGVTAMVAAKCCKELIGRMMVPPTQKS